MALVSNARITCQAGLQHSLVLETEIVGRTPWSARVPLDPLFALHGQELPFPKKPARGPAADQGVRPTNLICR
jgi:hypothetical protein